MMKKEVILVILISFLIVNVSAFNFEDRSYGLEKKPTPSLPINYSLVNVNNSYWLRSLSPQQVADLYTETDPIWTANSSLVAYYQFLDNDFNGSGDYVTTGTITLNKKTVISGGSIVLDDDVGGITNIGVSAGDLLIQSPQSIILDTTFLGESVNPASDNRMDLGEVGGSDYRWKDFYLAGSLSDETNSITIANIVAKADYQFGANNFNGSGNFTGNNLIAKYGTGVTTTISTASDGDTRIASTGNRIYIQGTRTGPVTEDIYFQYNDGWITIGSDTGQVFAEWLMSLKITDNFKNIFGTSNDADISWQVEDVTNSYLAIGVEAGSAAKSGWVSVIEKTSLGNAARRSYRDPPTTPIDPVFAVWSGDLASGSSNDYIALTHDRTDGVIFTGTGDIILNPAGDVKVDSDLNVTGIIFNPAIYCESSELDDQIFAVAGARYRLNISNVDEGNGISMSTGNNGTNITIDTSGVYHLVAQPQVKAGAGGAGDFHMWLEKFNSTGWFDIPDSNIELKLSSLEEDVIVLATTLKLSQGEKLRLVASVSDNKILLHAQSPTGEPVIPSIIFTMYRIGS